MSLLQSARCLFYVILSFVQAGGEKRDSHRFAVEDLRVESRSEAAAQSPGHCSVWASSRSDTDTCMYILVHTVHTVV